MKIRLKCSVALTALLVAAPAFAQNNSTPDTAPAPVAGSSPIGGNLLGLGTSARVEPQQLDQATEAKDEADIVVTGTYIRGVAPTGTETLTITAQDIREAGGLTTNDVLARIPQISNFFNTQIVSAPGQPQGVDTPQIHGLPTLILLDGHRVASAGTFTTSVDPSIIPKGVLQAIEVVPDGGSAIYGSDAVGGVINLTTKKRFDGVDVDGNVGFANNYRTYRLDATVGKAWSTGSVYLAYAYEQQSALYGRDRPYLQYTPAKTECTPDGTVSLSAFSFVTFTNTLIGQYTYPGVGANGKPTGYTPGHASCNEYTNETVTPEQHMHSLFGGLSQDLSSSIRFDLRGFYSTRRALSRQGFYNFADASVPSSNFYYTPIPGAPAGASQSAGIFLGGPTPSPNRLDTWGVSNEFTADVGHSFQVRLLGNYTQSYVHTSVNNVDSGLLSAALSSGNAATALDPYSVTITPASAALASEIAGRTTVSTGRTNESQGRLVTDGTLFHVPGGDLKIAVGGEILHDSFNSLTTDRTYSGATYQPTQSTVGSRTVSSAFGELEIPLISPDNHIPLVYGLHASIAGRYDHYSDFGGTFNPRFAASFMPANWLTFRATYGHSFVAPELTQEFSAQTGTIAPGIPFLLPPADTKDNIGSKLIILSGGNPALKAQKAKTYSLGMDVKVPGINGLKGSLTYYNATYTNEISTPPFTSPALFYTGTYAPFFRQGATAGGVGIPFSTASAFIGNVPVSGSGFTSLSQLYGPGGTVTGNSPVIIADARFQNLALVKTDGLDFDVSYQHSTSFGAVNFDAAGNYVLTDKNAAGAGQPYTDQLLTQSRFSGSVTAGTNIGNLRASVNLLHTAGYGLLANPAAYTQTSVKSYDTVNTFVSYTLKTKGYLNGTELTFNVNNAFNVRPAVNTSVNLGYSGGSIIGRTFQVALHQKF